MMNMSYRTLRRAVNWYYNRAAMAYTHTPSGMIPNARTVR